ncbi:MAG: SDR family NAD(P)-dependent oxidoreductase [Gammaproteobacteria bacterium]|jgi:NAD(P)-dependent dehydrogenase (short-subunit alcohol dehydrogenase family)|nr:SDR family NAD(P)-dependent oxidoreductase [Gammaproteobacteria bacterium]
MNNEIVLITGANRGLGLATAEALAKQGYQVIISARKQQALDELAQRFTKAGLKIDTLLMDVASDQSVQQAKKIIEQRYGKLDCLVNNAGVIIESNYEFTNLPSQVIADTFNINTLGAIRTMQAFYKLLAKSKNPRIVNMSSGMGAITDMNSGYMAYRISKTALNVATLQGHQELHDKYKIRVMALCPGWVKTDMGGPNATRELAEGISGIIWAVNTPANGPSGKFFRDGVEIPW